jgi:hypothetical protein
VNTQVQNTLPEIGSSLEGGFYAGRIQIDGILYALIVAPKVEGERDGVAWLESEQRVADANSYNNGMLNTRAMLEAGSEVAQWAHGLAIGGYTDWYIPSQDELEIIYRNLKPTAETNSLYGRSGVNISAPPPTFAYNRELPAKTTAEGFAAGGEHAFADEWYWSSTQNAAYDDFAWGQLFVIGNQGYIPKSARRRARAVRRLTIQ